MDFEQLITLIFVLAIWGISNVFRKAAKTDPRNHASAHKTPGFLETLQKNLAALQGTGDPGRAAELELDEFLQPPPEAKFEDQSFLSRKTPSSKHYHQTDSNQKDRNNAPIPSAHIPSEPLPGKIFKKAPGPDAVCRSLRDAVIWAEILAPPLALRDME